MTANEIFSTIRDWAVGKFQPRGDYASIGDLSGKLDFDGDSASNTISFTSEDSISPAGWTDLPVLSNGETHSGIMQKISVMFKNVRYLWQLLGSTDISAIGDGTVSGGLSALATSISALNLKTYNTLEQIGLTEPTTAAEIYAAIPDGSQVLLIDTSVTDAPTDGGGATVLFVKNSTHRGFILATGKTGKAYIMHLNSTGGNPTGVWVKLVEETDLGSADISAIGDGTVKGAISATAGCYYAIEIDSLEDFLAKIENPLRVAMGRLNDKNNILGLGAGWYRFWGSYQNSKDSAVGYYGSFVVCASTYMYSLSINGTAATRSHIVKKIAYEA